MTRIVALTMLLLLSLPSLAGAALLSPSDSLRVRPFLESALLAGTETTAELYEESCWRLHTELGMELRFCRPGVRSARAIGVVGSVSAGRDDSRSTLGIRATYPVGTRYAVQGVVGKVFSNVHDGRGLQVRLGFVLPWHVSAVGLWQHVTYDAPGDPRRHLAVDSLYGGVMLHDAPGACFSAVSWGLIAIVTAIALHAMGDALSGLD